MPLYLNRLTSLPFCPKKKRSIREDVLLNPRHQLNAPLSTEKLASLLEFLRSL